MLIEKDYRGSKHSAALTYSSRDDEQFYVTEILSTDGSGNPTAFTITNTNGDIVTATSDTGPGSTTYGAPWFA